MNHNDAADGSYSPAYQFPPVDYADQQGLLAIGGDLNPERVFTAHTLGIFPWFNDISNILWWAPPQRAVIPCARFYANRTLKKLARRHDYRLTLDSAFSQVIFACRRPESWIDEHMITSYSMLYKQKRAHSCELWEGDRLVGGTYGVCLEHVFCGESMFSIHPSASSLVLAALCRYLCHIGVSVIDTQFMTPHLRSLGAIEIPRHDYQALLSAYPDRHRKRWQMPAAFSKPSDCLDFF